MTNNNTHKSGRGNVLFTLNIFILFLLVFESKLVIPSVLQPIGRMHAMILHFPIVVVLMAMIMEFFRFRITSDSRKFYDELTTNLLFAGVVLAGITVIMGIFLAQEAGYNEEVLFWHKWTGVAVFFLSSLIYSLRNFSWFRAPVAQAGAIATALALIAAGHFGGSLTHGDRFIWQPVLSVSTPEVVPPEEALVFEHAIKPILESKCLSCHNADKRKGKLLLTDSSSVLKGGKSGKLFVAGNPEESLLLERIHLPLDDKKHMPPSGKRQLTKDEQLLLYHWVKSGVNLQARVQSLPESDSFRLVATRILEERRDVEDLYDFPAVAQETLDELNSNYRVIRPVSKNSPALAVNIYNKSAYTPNTLDELRDVKLQVVSLDLSKMPVTDEHLKYVARFENLIRLNLNFTEVTGGGLALLQPLKRLENLSLTGTAIQFDDLKRAIPLLENLNTLAIWETDVSSDEIATLQNSFPLVEILGAPDENETFIKLNPPRLKNKARVFDDSISPQLFHPVKGVSIRYTTNGEDPDSLSSNLFAGNPVIKETTAIKARAFKAGWLSSDVATLYVYRSSQKPDTAILLTKMNRVHTANGAQTFFDHELGSFNANSPAWANNWGGFIRNDMELLLRYDHPARINSVSLNTLIETETSIFPPASIEIWGGSSREDLKLIGRKTFDLPTVYKKPYIELQKCEFEDREVSWLKIIAKPVMQLPKWHKNKGKPALMLIDEILVN